MSYNFKKFDKRNVRLESRITITKSNSFGFPTKFSDDNNIKDYKYVVLFYDMDSKAIGIHFTNDTNDQNKFSIIKSEKYGASVVARSFFKSNSIDTKEHSGRYHWKKVSIEDVGELYVIELGNKDLKSE
jgi:hypothetical protein